MWRPEQPPEKGRVEPSSLGPGLGPGLGPDLGARSWGQILGPDLGGKRIPWCSEAGGGASAGHGVQPLVLTDSRGSLPSLALPKGEAPMRGLRAFVAKPARTLICCRA